MAEAAKDLHSEEEKDLQPLESNGAAPKHEAELPKDKANNVVELKTPEKKHASAPNPNGPEAKVLPFKKPENEKTGTPLLPPYFGDIHSIEEGLFKLLSDLKNGRLQPKDLQELGYLHCNYFPPIEYFFKHSASLTQEACQKMLEGIDSAQSLKTSSLFKKIITDPVVVARFEKMERNKRKPIFEVPAEVMELQKTRNIISALRAKLRRFLLPEYQKKT